MCDENATETFRLTCNICAYIHVHIPLDRKIYGLKFNIMNHRNKSQDYRRFYDIVESIFRPFFLLHFFIYEESVDDPKILTIISKRYTEWYTR